MALIKMPPCAAQVCVVFPNYCKENPPLKTTEQGQKTTEQRSETTEQGLDTTEQGLDTCSHAVGLARVRSAAIQLLCTHTLLVLTGGTNIHCKTKQGVRTPCHAWRTGSVQLLSLPLHDRAVFTPHQPVQV